MTDPEDDLLRSLAVLFDARPTVAVTTPEGSWYVPRAFIAAHGLKARDVPRLAAQHGWQRVPVIDSKLRFRHGR